MLSNITRYDRAKKVNVSVFPAYCSNFAGYSVKYEGIEYSTAEHAFQSAKTLDLSVRYMIAGLDSPLEAKREGRALDLRSDWEDVKYDVMLEIIRIKFKRHKDIARKLAATTRDIVELNVWHDNIWGDCVCSGCRKVEGQNLLGKILMQVRKEIRDNYDR